MNLTYSLEETYSGDYLLKAQKGEFKHETKIPKKKINNEKFILKQKSIIEKNYEEFNEVFLLMKEITGIKNEIKQEPYFLQSYSNFHRFEVEKGLNFLLLLKQDKDFKPYITLNYEKHIEITGFWSVAEIKKFYKKPFQNIKKEIEISLEYQWELYRKQNVLKDIIVNSFVKHYNFSLSEEKMSSYYVYEIEKKSNARRLFRFTFDQNSLVVLLKKTPESKNYEISFHKEYKNSGYHNVKSHNHWFTTEFNGDNNYFEMQLGKNLIAFYMEEQKKQNELNTAKRILSI